MPPETDHPLRYAIANELHARPFPSIAAPCQAAYLAFKPPEGAATRDRDADLRHLADLVERQGGPAPVPGATHHSGPLGRQSLKWESHTEFVTYTAFTPGLSPRAFDPAEADVFPPDWRAAAPGRRLVSALIRVEPMPKGGEDAIDALCDSWFVAESLACAWVLDGAAVVASDFRIDPAGHMRFAVFLAPETEPARVGRILQRLCEIETYKAMSMLGLGRARALSSQLNDLDTRLSALVEAMAAESASGEETLHALLGVSAELERLAMQAAFRFGATGAYEAIVARRIAILRESRYRGRETLGEFMSRRYDPAMRTVKSAEHRLEQMVERASRAGELLRTRVEVERSAQNQKLLESMDRRADMQLRLQHTVEGLSVVAISYYGVSLASYALTPVADAWGLGHALVAACLTPIVVAVSWLALRRIRGRVG